MKTTVDKKTFACKQVVSMILCGFLLLFSDSIRGQDSQLSLRTGDFNEGRDAFGEFSEFPLSIIYSPDFALLQKPQGFSVGFIYQYHPSIQAYRRLIAWMRPMSWTFADLQFQGDNLDLLYVQKTKSMEFGLAYGFGKQYEVGKFRFLGGIETGVGYRPKLRGVLITKFFGPGNAVDSTQYVNMVHPGTVRGYINIFGGVQYLIGKRLSLGIETGSGIQANMVSGDRTNRYYTDVWNGTSGPEVSETSKQKSFSVSLPASLSVPLLILSYRL